MSLSSQEISLYKDGEDSINNLPNDLLTKILSMLDTKSAVSTSILSKGWKDMYRSLTHFDMVLEYPNSDDDHEYDEKMMEFTKSLHNILDPNTAPNLKSLSTMFYYSCAEHKPLLDAFVLNAFRRKLEHFELEFNNIGSKYKFPLDSLDGLGDSFQTLSLCRCALIPQKGYLAFRSLKKLILSEVVFYETQESGEESRERFNFLINGCLNLEILTLDICQVYGGVRIDGSNTRLQEINCIDCYPGRIEIVSTPKLQKLNISLCNFKMDMEPHPSLKYVRLAFYITSLRCDLLKISSTFPYLETLVLCFEDKKVWLEAMRCSDSFKKLKHLIIEANIAEICHPFWIGILLDAAPFLETFEIQIDEELSNCQFDDFAGEFVPLNFQHKNLQVFKIMGFEGNPMEKNIFHYVSETATNLKQIVLRDKEGNSLPFDETLFRSI